MGGADEVGEVLIGECLVKLSRQPKVKTSDYSQSGAFPVIDQGTTFVGGYVNDESLLYTGPLPVVIFGDHNRNIKFVKSSFAVGADGTQLLRPDQRFDVAYFYYALRALPLKNYGYERHFKYLKEEKLRVWPRAKQRRIASILSAYDDLIENNTRRTAILEEMARRIYEEWFVRFRFPGFDAVPMVESELGLVPQGWRVTTLGQLAEVNARSVKRGAEPTEIRYVDISSVSTGSIDNKEPMSFADAPGRARRMVRDGDVIWACVRPNRKSYALVLNPEPNLLVSTGFAVLSQASAPSSFIYQCVTTDDFVSYLVNHAKGAAYPAVGAEEFENAKVLRPADNLVTEFDRIAEPMMRLVAALQRKNTNLRTTRDLLLPKLISGELDVSALPEPETVAA